MESIFSAWENVVRKDSLSVW